MTFSNADEDAEAEGRSGGRGREHIRAKVSDSHVQPEELQWLQVVGESVAPRSSVPLFQCEIQRCIE